ncbi:MAG TPA: 4-alpha-glucanotransferase, partial [Dehalococcoidales bacterium]
MRVTEAQLHHLAGLYGIKTGYLDMDKQIRTASPEALLAVLKALGAPVSRIEDVPSTIRAKKQQIWQQPIEPITVVWENAILALNLRLPENFIGKSLTAKLISETGVEQDFSWRTDESLVLDSAAIEKNRYVTVRLYLPEKLPIGYHRFRIELPGAAAETLIISAPARAYRPEGKVERIWGAFLPLYALHTTASWDAGDFGDLEHLMDWLNGMGGRLLGTLPLLPSFFDKEFGPGPYMPASRLFWNEFYLDVKKIPELTNCPSAQALIESHGYQDSLSKLRASHYVNYSRQLSLKRKVVEELAGYFFSAPSARLNEFRLFSQAHPQFEDYARFRAAGEAAGINWLDWPRTQRDGKLKDADYSPAVMQYHCYSQWLAHEQVSALCQKARESDLYLYMDLPVGVHPYSYDIWRERDSFVRGVNGGAPPDPVFTSGQNWNFPPLHPEKLRQKGYDYLIRSLRHQMQSAGMLRIDHIMNFHRLFWIPEGMEGREGVYVTYHPEEMYAILSLESCRNHCVVIGEDLGIVPPEVRPMMDKHSIFRMFVGQYQLIVENQVGNIPADTVASLNTHDMFPFASFWDESDIAQRQKLKLLDASLAQKEMEQRRQLKRALMSVLQYRGLDNEVSQDIHATLRAVLNLLAASPAYALLVNLEDLWLETIPQNIPGTLRKQNWSRKARYTLEKFSQMPSVLD